MKINDKSIRGIFVYSDTVTFERGDFVLDGDYLYVCQSETVTGESPSETPDKYSLYVGGEFATEEEFQEYANGTPDSGGKFVSAYLLGRLLNTYMAGYNEYGLITNHVAANGEIFMADYFGSGYGSTLGGVMHSDPLKEIMVQPSLNNAIFTVQRDLVNSILGTSQSATNSVLLKQYTYLETFGEREYVRVQELVDQETGTVMYRYSKSQAKDFSGTISTWYDTSAKRDILGTINNIKAYYETELEKLKKRLTNDETMFRFVSLVVGEMGKVSLASVLPTGDVYDSPIHVTLCLIKSDTGTNPLHKSCNITFPITRSTLDYSYSVFDDDVVRVELRDRTLSFSVSKISSGSSITLQDAYYRQTKAAYQERERL